MISWEVDLLRVDLVGVGFVGVNLWGWLVLSDWNGVSMMTQPDLHSPDIQIFSDASCSWGCSAIWDNQWFQVAWDSAQEFALAPIAAKELLPILVAIAVWGKEWLGKTVEFHCDNQVVVSVLQSGACKEPNMVHMLGCLFFCEASHSRLSICQVVTMVQLMPYLEIK